MSYDIRICVKIEGYHGYAEIDEPEYDSPTYNLGDMFRACMDWNYTQGQEYPCDYVIKKVEHGINELRTHRAKYEKYNPPNGWGDLDEAIRVLESLRECIYQNAENIPIEYLYMRW